MARKQLVGVVASNRMSKTVVVRVIRLVRHPVYERVTRRSKKFKAHNPGLDIQSGDEVLMEEVRPLSKEVRWRLVKIVRKGIGIDSLDSEAEQHPKVAVPLGKENP